jgi:hypothetical protein
LISTIRACWAHTHTRLRFLIFLSKKWTLFKSKLRLQNYKPSYSASAMKLPSSDRLLQPRHLQDRKPVSQTLRSLLDKHISSIHGFRQLGLRYRSTAKQLAMPLPNSTTSTLISTHTSKPWCFPSCLKPMRRPMTIIRSSTSLYAFTTI